MLYIGEKVGAEFPTAPKSPKWTLPSIPRGHEPVPPARARRHHRAGRFPRVADC
jgi:hypothetical protein